MRKFNILVVALLASAALISPVQAGSAPTVNPVLNVAGGWSNFNFTLTPAAEHVFHEVTGRLLGVKYTPLAFATQVVAGTHYSFLAESQVVVPNAPEGVVVIHVFQPLGGGTPYITKITEVPPGY